MFVVTVMFRTHPGAIEGFLPLMQGQADASVKNEEGCLRFDVCRDPERPDEVFLYEIYASERAFQVHLESPHYKTFSGAISELVAEKQVRTYRLLDQGGLQDEQL